MIRVLKNSKVLFLIGLLLCIPIILPYFHSGYFPSHDGEWAVVRAGEMFREIRDYQFPPRYSGVLNFGYGYPLFNFAYPFPYYLSTILHFFKFGFVDSVKFIFALSVITSYAGMFILAAKYWKTSLAGFLSGVLYIYLPYRLVDLFVRGSIGESVAFAIYPFLLFFCIDILKNKEKVASIFFTSILFAILITTHNISAVYFGLIFLAVFLHGVFVQKNRSSWVLLGAFFWGALMSCFFWLPALLEKGNILLSTIPIADRNLYYVSPLKLLYSSWGYETPTDKTPFTYQIGVVQIISFFVMIFTLTKLKKINLDVHLTFILLTLLFIFMTFSASFFIWKLPLLSEINYPWTLLLPIGFLMSFLSSGFIGRVKYSSVILSLFVLLAIILNIPHAKPERFVDRSDSYYLTNEATTTSSQELMPLWVKKLPTSRFINKIETTGDITNLLYTSKKISFDLNTKNKEFIKINQIYYPGWEATVNSHIEKIKYANEKGVMQLSVNSGKSHVNLLFKETKLRLISDIISIFAALLLAGLSFVIVSKKIYGKTKKD